MLWYKVLLSSLMSWKPLQPATTSSTCLETWQYNLEERSIMWKGKTSKKTKQWIDLFKKCSNINIISNLNRIYSTDQLENTVPDKNFKHYFERYIHPILLFLRNFLVYQIRIRKTKVPFVLGKIFPRKITSDQKMICHIKNVKHIPKK